MKYILEQDTESLLNKFLTLQLKFPTRGDWASSCLKDLKYLEIEIRIEEIKEIKRKQFLKMINESIQKKSFEYLQTLRGSKGKEITYYESKMANYLKPSNENLNITEKRFIFAMRNRMIPIENNFPNQKQNKEENCKSCGETEDMRHIYAYNKSQENYIEYENIFGENVKMIRKVYQHFKTNYDIKENQKKSLGSPRDPLCDPLFSILECSN